MKGSAPSQRTTWELQVPPWPELAEWMTGSDSGLSDQAATNLFTRNASRPMRAAMRMYEYVFDRPYRYLVLPRRRLEVRECQMVMPVKRQGPVASKSQNAVVSLLTATPISHARFRK